MQATDVDLMGTFVSRLLLILTWQAYVPSLRDIRKTLLGLNLYLVGPELGLNLLYSGNNSSDLTPAALRFGGTQSSFSCLDSQRRTRLTRKMLEAFFLSNHSIVELYRSDISES